MDIDAQKYVDRLSRESENLRDAIESFISGHDSKPWPGSPAMQEIAAYPREDLLATAYAQGRMRIQAAANHYHGFARTLQAPVLAIATWANARAVVETSALAAWLLDPGIDASERVRRSYVVRFEGLKNQRLLAKGDYVNELWDRTEQLAREAASLGYTIREERGKKAGIAPGFPGFTKFTTLFGYENFYRTASGMTHGFDFAIAALAMSYGSPREAGGPFSPGIEIATEVSISFDTVDDLCKIVAPAYGKAAATLARLYGWDVKQIQSSLRIHSAALHEVRSDLISEMCEARHPNDSEDPPSS
jgi:hypothetical protein